MNGFLWLPSSVFYMAMTAMSQPAIAAIEQNQAYTAPSSVEQLVTSCAPQVHPNTMLKVLKHESGLQPYLIGVNGTPRQVFKFGTKEEAAKKARELIAQGKSIDMGLGQINSQNLSALRLTPEQVFEPCQNIKASATLLAEAYGRTSAAGKPQHQALDQALSIYNTGKTDRGIANGYVAKVRGTQYSVPALDGDSAPAGAQAVAVQAEPEAPPPEWDVFATANYRGPRQREAQAELAAAVPSAAGEQEAVMLFKEPR